MKLKDLFKMIESNNKFANFMERNGYKELQVIEIDGRDIEEEFTKANDLIKEINECYYANIDDNIELINNNGYIEMTFEQNIPNFKLVDGILTREYIKEKKTVSLYIKIRQVWE